MIDCEYLVNAAHYYARKGNHLLLTLIIGVLYHGLLRGLFISPRLKALVGLMGINPGKGCQCNERAALMDQWGVKGCRERREEIIG